MALHAAVHAHLSSASVQADPSTELWLPAIAAWCLLDIHNHKLAFEPLDQYRASGMTFICIYAVNQLWVQNSWGEKKGHI